MIAQLPTRELTNAQTGIDTLDVKWDLAKAAALLDRVQRNGVELQKLVADPLGVAREAGLDLWGIVKVLLDLSDASDLEVVDVLQARLRRAQAQPRRTGCGNCGVEYCAVDPV